MSYPIREVASGLGFIEGPMELKDGRILFTEVSSGMLKVYDPRSETVTSFAETKGGPNGTAIGPDGAFYVCNNGGLAFTRSPEGLVTPISGSRGENAIQACIQRVTQDGEVTTLYSHCNGEPLLAPNDLVFDSHGSFYFTDSGHPHGRMADLGGLYYAKSDGSEIVELIHEVSPAKPLTQPNGCGLSPGGTQLYVAETATGRLWAWDIANPQGFKRTTNSAWFSGVTFLYRTDGIDRLDSLAVDSAGYICIGTILKGGISVVRPDGTLDAFIPLPEYDPFPTNICFAGTDHRKAYVTAASTGRLYEIDWPRPGLKLNYQ